jgi:hypothetical protein
MMHLWSLSYQVTLLVTQPLPPLACAKVYQLVVVKFCRDTDVASSEQEEMDWWGFEEDG